MNGRRFVILLAAAVVVAAAAFWSVSRQHAPPLPSGGATILPELRGELNSVTEIRLQKAGGPQATLRKSGSGWTVVERDFTADAARVRKLLLDLSALQVVEEKTREPARYRAIGVEDLGTPKADSSRIDVTAGAKTHSVIVGITSGSRWSYVRVAGNPQSYLASPQVSVDADPRQWIERNVLELPEQRIREVALVPSTGPAYTISRAKAEDADFAVSGVPAKRKLKSGDTARSIASAVASLTADDIRKSEPLPAAAAPATATYRTFDGLTLRLTGRKDGELHYVSVRAESAAKETADEAAKLNARLAGRELEISGFKYDAIFRPLDDLLAPP